MYEFFPLSLYLFHPLRPFRSAYQRMPLSFSSSTSRDMEVLICSEVTNNENEFNTSFILKHTDSDNLTRWHTLTLVRVIFIWCRPFFVFFFFFVFLFYSSKAVGPFSSSSFSLSPALSLSLFLSLHIHYTRWRKARLFFRMFLHRASINEIDSKKVNSRRKFAQRETSLNIYNGEF